MAVDGPSRIVVFRPTSVMGPGRPIASRLARILRARWLVVPSGDPPLPVALLDNVADAIVFIASLDRSPPILLHPWEGMTVHSLARAFGRPTPIRTIPRPLADPAKRLVRLLVNHGGPLSGRVRRVEVLWEGQRQRSSLPALGFAPGDQDARYAELGATLRDERAQ